MQLACKDTTEGVAFLITATLVAFVPHKCDLTFVTRQKKASNTTEQRPPTVKADAVAPTAEWIAKAGAPSESQTFSGSMTKKVH